MLLPVYTVQSPLFVLKIVEKWAQQAAILIGGRFGHPEALPLGIFESNYKRTASEGYHECSISTILRKKSDCEQSINVIIDRNQLFYHVN